MSNVVVVTLDDSEHRGRGEGGSVFFLGDDMANMRALLETHRAAIEAASSRDELRTNMPAGGARNAVDCALWELEAARAATPVWQLAGISGQAAAHDFHTGRGHA